MHVFQVGEGSFPPLRSLDRLPGNLPVQATSFVGRQAEVAELVGVVGAHRLVTLTGVGGVGKTRLALQVGAELAGEFAEGVWLVELAPVGDPAAVADAVATALGVTPRPGSGVADSVAVALSGRHMLVVVDNCEHVLDAAAEVVEAILARTTAVKVLATSREGLRVAGEHVWPVPSLEVAAGVGSAAVELFVDRARAVAPGFGSGRPGRRRRGHRDLPAAGRDRLGHRVGRGPDGVHEPPGRAGPPRRPVPAAVGSAAGLERHQTLRQAVGWSYDLLDEDERTVLNRVAVFAGGFDLAAAAAVLGQDSSDEYALLDVVDSLVRKSLVIVGRAGGHARYGHVGDHPPVRRGTAGRHRDHRRDPGPSRPLLRRTGRRPLGHVGRARPAGGAGLGRGGVGQPAGRVSLGRRPARPGRRRGHRRPHRHAGRGVAAF